MNFFDDDLSNDEPLEPTSSNKSTNDMHRWQSEIESFVTEIADELDDIAQLLNCQSDFAPFAQKRTDHQVSSRQSADSLASSEPVGLESTQNEFDDFHQPTSDTAQEFNSSANDSIENSASTNGASSDFEDAEQPPEPAIVQPVESNNEFAGELPTGSDESASNDETSVKPEATEFPAEPNTENHSAEDRLASLRERLSKLRVGE